MSTASTQFEDERRLYAMIEKRHREADQRVQIRMARADRPSGVEAFLVWTRKAIGGVLESVHSRKARLDPTPQAMPVSTHGDADTEPAAGVVTTQ